MHHALNIIPWYSSICQQVMQHHQSHGMPNHTDMLCNQFVTRLMSYHAWFFKTNLFLLTMLRYHRRRDDGPTAPTVTSRTGRDATISLPPCNPDLAQPMNQPEATQGVSHTQNGNQNVGQLASNAVGTTNKLAELKKMPMSMVISNSYECTPQKVWQLVPIYIMWKH